MADPIVTKFCARCNNDLSLSAFGKNRSKRDGLSSYCKRCCCAWQKRYVQSDRGRETHRRSVARWYHNGKGKDAAKRYIRRKLSDNPYFIRDQHLKHKYELTADEYNELLRIQNGGCAICGKKPPLGKTLAVDHDHKTGEVRGLLCNSHNVAIGLLGDSSKLAQRAADYLNNPPSRQVHHGM